MSTVLDVAICLLLVGVAVATLTAAVPADERPAAFDERAAADSLVTVTATVPAGEGRSVHGTLAEQLTQAAIVAATLDGARLTVSSYPTAVREAVDEHTRDRVHITARWSPYAAAPLESRVTVGLEPPESADVAVATRTMGSGIDSPRIDGIESFDALATAIATAYIDRLFPPDRTRVRLADPRTAPETEDRYRITADTLDINEGIEPAITDAAADRANDRLAAALADRLEADLRKSYETPGVAAEEIDLRRVEIVVRRWEP